jgi:hypothetical protein
MYIGQTSSLGLTYREWGQAAFFCCNEKMAGVQWQYAVVFTAVNIGVLGFCGQIFDNKRASICFLVMAISIFMSGVNVLFRGLVARANQWIVFFTDRSADVERARGTETGVLVFSHPNYPGKEDEEKSVQGIRFRTGIVMWSNIMIGVWGVAALLCMSRGMYLMGQGAW